MLKSLLKPTLAALLVISASAAARAESINGRWIMGDGPSTGVLVIRGNDWFLDRIGSAVLKHGKGAANLDVYYTKKNGAHCAYRVHLTNQGETLILEPADPQQSPDFCPSGKLARVSN